jgi:two-component system chemotaxis response regulator CheY
MATKIMVVDDSMMVRAQVGRALVQANFEVIEAKDGQEALEKLRQIPGIGLVVCDVTMPRMSGLELLQELANDTSVQRVPFVMLTTEGQAERIQRAKELGAKAWILKPFKADLLVAAVQKLAAIAA